jgi:hypothetical protein
MEIVVDTGFVAQRIHLGQQQAAALAAGRGALKIVTAAGGLDEPSAGMG